MPRNITAAQKLVRDFHKSDALAQTNQIKYDCFFLHGTENIKKIFSQDLKLETKARARFSDFALFFKGALMQIQNSTCIFVFI